MAQSKIIAEMTGRQIIDALSADTPLARVQRILSDHCAAFEQAQMQRQRLTPIEGRRMELQAANKICALFGIGLA